MSDWKHDKCGHGYDRHNVVGVEADGGLKLKCIPKGEQPNLAMQVFLALTARYEGLVEAAKKGRADEIAALRKEKEDLVLGRALALRQKQEEHERGRAEAVKELEASNANLQSELLSAQTEIQGLNTAVDNLQKELDEKREALIGQAVVIGRLNRKVEELSGVDGKSETTVVPLPGASAPKPATSAPAVVVPASAKPAAVIVPHPDEGAGGGAAETAEADGDEASPDASGDACDGGCGKPAKFLLLDIPLKDGSAADSACCGETACYKAIFAKHQDVIDTKKVEDDFELRKKHATPIPGSPE